MLFRMKNDTTREPLDESPIRMLVIPLSVTNILFTIIKSIVPNSWSFSAHPGRYIQSTWFFKSGPTMLYDTRT